LQLENDIKVVGVSRTRGELMNILKEAEVDHILLDINLNSNDNFNRSGIEIAMEIKQLYPKTKIMIVSSIDEAEIVTHALTIGRADNYVLKSCYQDVAQTIRDGHSNRNNIHYSCARTLLEALTIKTEKELHDKINNKQKEILALIDEGLSRKDIANLLFTSEQVISNEIFKIAKILRSKTPYFEMFRIKKVNIRELLELAKRLKILKTGS
jgi:DNA-binding NarL/FixJ family response regulator